MPKHFSDKTIQEKVINEMVILCGEDCMANFYCVHQAAKLVSGESISGNDHDRRSPYALVTISTRTVERWYNH